MPIAVLPNQEFARRQLRDVFIGLPPRDATLQAEVAFQVAKWTITNVNYLTFGLFLAPAGDSQVSIASGTTALSSASDVGPWSNSDVGKLIDIQGAGPAGATLRTTIVAFTDANHVTVGTAASTTVASTFTSASGLAIWGQPVSAALVGSQDIRIFGAVGDGVTDDTAAFVAASAVGIPIVLGAGTFRIGTNCSIAPYVIVRAGASIVVPAAVTVNFLMGVGFDGGTVSVASTGIVNFNKGINAARYAIFNTGGGQVNIFQEVYPQWWGAIGDGANDDSIAINAAIQAASGGIVYLIRPPTAYKIVSSILVNKSVKIIGIGGLSQINVPAASAIDVFDIRASLVEIEGFRIVGNSTQTGACFKFRTDLFALSYIYISKIRTSLMCDCFLDVNSGNTMTNLYVRDCYHSQPTGRGVLFNKALAFIFFQNWTVDYVGTTTNVPANVMIGNAGTIWSNCDVLGGSLVATGNRWGFDFEQSSAVWLWRCDADTCGGYGFRFLTCDAIHMTDCVASLNDQHGILLSATTNFELTNCFTQGRNALSGTASQQGVLVISSSEGTITGHKSKLNTGDGIRIDTSSSCVTTGGTMAGNTGRGYNAAGASTLGTGMRFQGNTAGNYSLGSVADFIATCLLNAGTVTATITGSATG